MKGEVLVVDDDEDIRLSICEILEDEGYIAVGIDDGQQALERLRTHSPPCLMFLDLMMPGVDGWEVLRQRASDPQLSQIPVVVITAGGHQRSAGAQANRVLAKPLRLEDVLNAAKEFCGSSEVH